MTKAKEIFNYYCIDKIKPIEEELVISYKDDEVIRKVYFKLALRAKIKKVDCFILYTASDEDLETFVYLPADIYYDNCERFYLDVIPKDEYMRDFKRLYTINVFEFTSLLDFQWIYDSFKRFVEYNWNTLHMDSLIEL